LWAALQFYRLPTVLLAPNLELVELLHHQTGKPTFLMRRGVDTTLFSRAKRGVADGTFRFGFVGRLSSEKNVRLLPRLEQALLAAGHTQVRFLIVGDGRERPWLEQHMTHADFTGVLHGESLARAYANMDLLVFPSEPRDTEPGQRLSVASSTPTSESSRTTYAPTHPSLVVARRDAATCRAPGARRSPFSRIGRDTGDLPPRAAVSPGLGHREGRPISELVSRTPRVHR
jgi:hypothetical protein